MAKLAALLFDVDGTLADTERDGHRVAFNQAFHQAGLDWDWTVAIYGELLSVTGGKERIRFFIDHYLNGYQITASTPAFIAGWHEAKTRIYTQMLAEGAIPLRTGVERLMREARQRGVTLAIATTTTPENVTALLEHTLGVEAIDWFDVIAAGDVVPSKKPAPDIYHFAMQQLGLGPDQCLAFEDSENGLLSARGAGLKTVITINDYTRQHQFGGAALVLDQLGEPDQPFKVIQGDVGQAQYFSMDLAQHIHADP